jgi:hypothetical protein
MGYFDLLQSTSQLFGDFGDKSKYVSQQRYSKYFSTPSNVLDIVKNRLVSSTPTEAIIIDESAIDKNPNKKRILMKSEETIAVGDTITVTDWGNSDWLCTNRDPDDDIYNAGIIEKCNNTLNFSVASTPYSYPCIILDKSSQYSSGTDIKEYLVLQEGQVMVIVSEDDYTNTIEENDRFIFNNKRAFELTRINDLTQPQSGLLYLTMVVDEKSSNDDLDNNLPDDDEPTIPDDHYI